MLVEQVNEGHPGILCLLRYMSLRLAPLLVITMPWGLNPLTCALYLSFMFLL